MATVNLRQAPQSSYSPVAQKGVDIQPAELTVNGGLYSFTSELGRPSTYARILDNFQMLTQNIWSNPTGMGWSKQRASAFNSGASFMEFGVFEDFVGNQTLLFQVGNQMYSYNIATITETAYNAPLTGLSTSIANLPCIQSFIDNTASTVPITVYCNGAIQPVKITGTAAANNAYMKFTATGGSTMANPAGGVFGIPVTLAGLPAGNITEYAITASGTGYGCCLGPDGNVWYCDYANSKIGKITPAGVVTEYATTTPAAGPRGICAGPDGNIWFTEYLANNVCKITPAGVITEYNGLADVNAPAAICLGSDNNLWVANHGANGITKVTTSGVGTGYASFGGGTWAICAGPDGNLWFPSITANQFNRMTTAGVLTTFTPGLPGTNVIYSCAAGPDGNIWATDNVNGTLYKITIAGVLAATYTLPQGTAAAPVGIAAGPDGNMWVAEFGSNKIAQVTTSGVVTEYKPPTAGSTPWGICVGADNALWFTEQGATQIGRITTAAVNPIGVCPGPDGNIWFCEYATNKIGKITPTGTLTEYLLPNANSGPRHICSDDTNLWFTEYLGNRIGKITPSGTITEYSAGLSAGALPVDIVLGSDNNMWFCESGTSKVAKITSGGAITEYATTTPNAIPWGICSDGTNLWITESGVYKIAKVTTGGVFTEYATPTINSQPLHICYNTTSTKLWFTEYAANNVCSATTGGAITEYPVPTAASGPTGITAASDGNVYFTEKLSNKIGRVIPASATFNEWTVIAPSSQPLGICDGPDQSIWFTESLGQGLGNLLYGGSGTWPGVFTLTKKTYSKPRFCCYFNNREVFFGFDPTTNAALDCLISNQGDAEKFITSTPINATDAISFTMGGLGLPTGCHAFRPINTTNQEVLLLGYQRGIAIVQGTDVTNYQITVLTREFGLMSNRTWVQIQNDLYFMSTNGWRRFSQLAVNSNMFNASLSYGFQDWIQMIDTTHAVGATKILSNSSAFAVHHPSTLEVQCWVPWTLDLAGSVYQNGHAIIMNYNTTPPGGDQPEILSPIFSTKSATTVACGINFQGTFYGGGYDGLLQTHYSGNTYNGNAIPGTLATALATAENIQQSLSLLQGIVVTEGDAQDFLITTYFYEKLAGNTQVDGTLRRQPSPEGQQELKQLAGTTTKLGSWTMGSSSFPQNHIKHLLFTAKGQGPYAGFIITTNSTSHTIDFEKIAYTIESGGLRI